MIKLLVFAAFFLLSGCSCTTRQIEKATCEFEQGENAGNNWCGNGPPAPEVKK